jgi:hypothetical protein
VQGTQADIYSTHLFEYPFKGMFHMADIISNLIVRLTHGYSKKQRASVLVMTLMVMLIFSGQIMMMGLVSNKSLAESGASAAMADGARNAAYQAMDDFEIKDAYPTLMGMINTAKTTTSTTTHITATDVFNLYGKTAPTRTDGTGTNWEAYTPTFWNSDTNAYVNSPYTVNVWLEPASGTTDGYPFRVVARVKGNGINQVLFREVRVVPNGYTDI